MDTLAVARLARRTWHFSSERAPRASIHRTTIYSAPFVFGTAPAPAEE